MIITQRSAGLTYSTDAVAASLRSVIAATPAAPSAASEVSCEAVAGQRAPFDLAVLYPALVEAPGRKPLAVRLNGAVAFRLSVLGTALVILLIMHH